MFQDFITGITIFVSLFTGSQTFGAFSDPFLSVQLAASPSNGLCLTTDGTNNAWSTCATGGGGGSGGTWSTTTSQVSGRLVNYSNNTSDLVAIGSNSTTTAEFWFDPNTLRSFLSNASSSAFTATNLFATNFTIGGDTFDELIGTGLQLSSGDLQTTLGTDITVGEMNASDFGDFTCNGAACLIDTNTVTLATDTTGNYVATLADSGGSTLTISGSGAENAAVTAGINLANPNTWTGLQTFSAATSTNFGITNSLSFGGVTGSAWSAFCTSITGSSALCDGDDATGGGGSTPDSKWATSTDNAIYPSGNNASVILGRSNQLGRDCLICLFGTSTSGTLIFASSTANFDTSFIRFLDSTAVEMFEVNAQGNVDIGGNLDVTSDISSLAGVSSPIFYLSNAGGAQLTNGTFGAITFAAFGGTHDENLTLNLDSAANTALWSSSTGVTAIDWSAFNLTTSGRLTSGTMTVTSLTSALLLTDGSGVFAEYTGSNCTNQVVTAISALGAATCTTLNGNYLDLTANYAWTGTHDLGGGGLEIPNGTDPTVDAIGEIALDTTDNQLIIATSTTSGSPAVIPTTKQSLGSFTISSSTPPFYGGFSSGIAIPFKIHTDGYIVREIHCDVDGGTSIVINFDNGSGNTDSITCDADGASDLDLGANNTVTAGSVSATIETGTVTGAVNYLRVSVFGQYVRE